MFYINILEHVYLYIEKEIVENFSFDSIMDEFKNLKNERQSFVYVWFLF